MVTDKLYQIKRKAVELARDIQVYINENQDTLCVDFDYYGCRELGWVCRIEVKE